jgi:hypothetical protein
VVTSFVIPNLILAPMIAWLTAGGLADDDDDKKKKKGDIDGPMKAAIREMISGVFQGVPFGRDIMDAVAAFATGSARRGSIFEVSSLRPFEDAINDSLKAADALRDGDEELAAYEAIRALTGVMGVPALSAYERFRKLWGQITGKKNALPDLRPKKKKKQESGYRIRRRGSSRRYRSIGR